MTKLMPLFCRAFLLLLLGGGQVFAQSATAPVAAPAAKKTIVFLGDSLSAGLGVKPEEAFPALIEDKIQERGLPFEVVNAGLSGDTTAGGLRRIDWILQREVDILVLELGANDGLRGLPVPSLKQNLQAMIDKAKAKNPQVQVVIAGMQIPPNVGAQYAESFRQAYAEIAKANNAALIPFLLDGVGGARDLNQADQIHPNPRGHQIVADVVWKTLEPLLKGTGSI